VRVRIVMRSMRRSRATTRRSTAKRACRVTR
jgi:hypothetical protein